MYGEQNSDLKLPRSETKDVQALDKVLARMPLESRMRMANYLRERCISRLSQVVARSSWHDWRYRQNLGLKTLAPFAKALAEEGVQCYVTEKFRFETRCEKENDGYIIVPLTKKDWVEIAKVPWDKDGLDLIKFMRKRGNKPSKLGKAIDATKSNRHPGVRVFLMNITFKRHALTYRIKIGPVPESGTRLDRLIQIGVLPA